MNQPTFADDIALSKLKVHLETGKSVAFIGSGPSTDIYKPWPQLVRSICKECGIPLDKRYNERSLDANQMTTLIDAAKALDIDGYRTALVKEYGREVVEFPRVYNLLFELPFSGYVTLNFDPLLAKIGQRHNKTVHAFPYLPIRELSSKTIFYAHGRIEPGEMPKAEHIVLGKSDFGKAYGEKGALDRFFSELFTFSPVIFIGCTLSEPEFSELLILSAAIQKRQQLEQLEPLKPRTIILPNRYTTLGREGFDRQEQSRDPLLQLVDRDAEYSESEEYDVRNIEVLRYANPDGGHSGLEQMFEHMSGVVRPAPGTFAEEPLPI